ncbi:hypothetical protein [Mongoliitalea daihaiensis]|uniref:hypothetical protein n=1 Tax=Mongoliitalea daihaiensis TaxID=2782006 RepID=UPI001F34D6EC|nr:hypothetical protein [Mongoliitalea daihaiensis]UJP64472.1 hypothetical protein IPZ59_16945 [Mongoliitalea daihaiensis]
MLHYFYVISILVALLPSISSIPRVPHYELFFIGALGISFTLNPKVFLKRNFIVIFFLLLLHFIYQSFNIYNEDNARKFTNFIVPILISSTYFEYYNLNRSKSVFFLKTFIAGLIITAITTSIALEFFPDASRAMAGALSKEGNTELINFYLTIGVGGYAFSLMWMLTSLFLIYIYVKKGFYFFDRKMIIVFLVIQVYAFYKMGFTTPLLLFFIAVLALPYKWYLTDFKRSILSIFFIFFLFSVFSPLIINFIYSSADFLKSDFLSPRLTNIAMRLDGSLESTDFSIDIDTKLQDGNQYLGGYEIRASKSFDAFISNPFFGGGDVGGHNFYLDILGTYGLLGASFIFYIIYTFYKRSINSIHFEDLKLFYKYSFIFFFVLGVVKTYSLLLFFLYMFVFLPLLLNWFAEVSFKKLNDQHLY